MDKHDRLFPIYRDMLRLFPDDLHLARPMISLLQQRGEDALAAKLAFLMAKRMRDGSRYHAAMSFLTMAENLGYPETEEVKDLKSLVEILTMSGEPDPVASGAVFSLLEPLSDQEVRAFLLDGEVVTVKAGSVVVRQGEVSRSFYLILHGQMEVELTTEQGEQVPLATLQAGTYFGEFASVYQMQRSATVRAGSDARLLRFSDQTIQRLMDDVPIAGEQLMRVVQQRMITNLTYEHPAFADLSEGDRAWLADEARVRVFQKGEDVCQDASLPNQWLTLISGPVTQITHFKPVGEIKVGTMVCGASGSLRREDTMLRAKGQALVCDAPLEIFSSFMKVYDSFSKWVKAQG